MNCGLSYTRGVSDPKISTLDTHPGRRAPIFLNPKPHPEPHRFTSAAHDFSRVLEMKPGHSGAEKELSVIAKAEDSLKQAKEWVARGDAANAGGHLDQVVLLHAPDCKEVNEQPGVSIPGTRVLFQQSGYLHAIMHEYPGVHIIIPRSWQARLMKAQLLVDSKDYAGAVVEAGKVLKEEETNLEGLLLRGRSYYYLADHEVAMRWVGFGVLGFRV